MSELNHVAIIMDGNSRWGRINGVSERKAYNSGVEAAKKIIAHVKQSSIKYLTLFAFSTENWRRDHAVIGLLMEIFSSYFEEYLANIQSDINKNYDVKISFIGERSLFPDKIQELMEKIESIPIDQPRLYLRIAMNYGGKEDIKKASEKLVLYYLQKFGHSRSHNENILKNQPQDEPISDLIFDKGIEEMINPDRWPDPELLIRTGGERRLSNFILWYLSYTELYFTDDLWPDFNEDSFDKAIKDYKKRERRFGA